MVAAIGVMAISGNIIWKRHFGIERNDKFLCYDNIF